MSCRRHRRWISDRLDGALGPRRARRLEAHLRGCPDCRAYEARLGRMNAEASKAAGSVFTRDYGEDFLRRLNRRLDRERPRSAPASLPVRRRWVWATAGLAAAAGAVIAGLLIFRPVPSPEIYALSEFNSFSRIIEQYTRNPELENSFNDELLSSIDDNLMSAGETFPTDPFDNPLLWEGLSRDEKIQLENDIASEQAL